MNTKRIAYVVSERMLSQLEIDRLRTQWNNVHEQSNVEAPPIVILTGCMSLTFHDAPSPAAASVDPTTH